MFGREYEPGKNNKELFISIDDIVNPLDMEMVIEDEVSITIDEAGGSILPYYTGRYHVTPKVKSQKLETKNKSMSNDVDIDKIPYEEVHNVSGITVTIGGIM